MTPYVGVRSLHCWSDADTIVPPERSRRLAARFMRRAHAPELYALSTSTDGDTRSTGDGSAHADESDRVDERQRVFEPVIVQHPNAHAMPTDDDTIKRVVEFLRAE